MTEDPAGFPHMERLGLAGPVSAEVRGRLRDWIDWIEVETTTAAEFMAALAMSLCTPGFSWQYDQYGRPRTWTPITDKAHAASALLAGLQQVDPADPPRSEQSLRTEGDLRVADVRSSLLEQLLPVPAYPLPVQHVVDFRRRHGDLLPQLRQHIERALDEVIEIDDPVMRQRRLDQIAEDAEEQIEQAEAYLKEAGVRRIARSSLFRVLRPVPVVGPASDVVRDIAANSLRHSEFTREPLAYFAFARAEFDRTVRYRVDPFTGIPLVDAMTARRS